MGGDENKVPEKQQQKQQQQVLEPDYKYSNYIESSPNMHYQTIESKNYSTNNYESNPYLPSRNKYGSNNYK